MKKAWDDVKSFITILFAIALVGLLYITVFKSEKIFEAVFVLFTHLATAVFTYYFVRKKEDKKNDNNI